MYRNSNYGNIDAIHQTWRHQQCIDFDSTKCSLDTFSVRKPQTWTQMVNTRCIKKPTLNIHECFFRFEQQNGYEATAFEPQSSIPGLNIVLVLCRISSPWSFLINFNNSTDCILSPSRVLQNQTIYFVLAGDLAPFKHRVYMQSSDNKNNGQLRNFLTGPF